MEQMLVETHEAEGLEVRENPETRMMGLWALRAFRKGETVFPFFAAEELDHPTRLTVQIGERRHISLLPEALQYTNHGCDPNVLFNTDEMRLEALREILPGEELRYFYPATEWRMDEPFVCNCGALNCLGRIDGAWSQPASMMSKYKVSSYIAAKLKARDQEDNA
jgi:hypothetical protein